MVHSQRGDEVGENQLRGWLDALARNDPKLAYAFLGRKENPKGWKAQAKRLEQKLIEQFRRVPTWFDKRDREMQAALAPLRRRLRDRHELGEADVKKPRTKVAKVMREFGSGKLHSGSKKGPVVKSRKQAVAIALSEKRKGKR